MGRAESILAEVHNQRRFKHEWMRMRRDIARAGLAESIKQSVCPACGQGLYKRAVEAIDRTVVHCLGCGWYTIFEGLYDEATALGDRFVPGVTGRTKGTPVVTIRDGKIVRIQGV